jgi:putative FmdB family regulatory protein
MPTYQYVCGQCDAPLEVVQSFSDDALTTCPECKAEALKKVYGSVGVVFKGSGFYRNDSRGTTTSATQSATDSSSTSSSAPATPTAAPAAVSAPASTPSPSA